MSRNSTMDWMYGICTQHVYTGSGHHETYAALKNAGNEISGENTMFSRMEQNRLSNPSQTSCSSRASTPDYVSHEEGFSPPVIICRKEPHVWTAEESHEHSCNVAVTYLTAPYPH